MKTSLIGIILFSATLLSIGTFAPGAVHAQLVEPDTGLGGGATDQGFTPLISGGIPGLTDKPITDSKGFADFFNKLYAYLIGAAVILAVIMIVWGGLEYSTQDSVSKKSDGKSKIYNALFGLVLVLSPALVFSIINPKILELNVNFPPLHTTWGDFNPSTCTGANCTTTTSDGYNFSGGIATCTDNATCDAAYNACKATGTGANTPLGAIRCRKTDGTLTSRQDYKIIPGRYVCASGESLVVTCQKP